MQIFAGQVRFGIHAGPQERTFPEYLQLWRNAEEWGYDWASVFDHFMPINNAPIEGTCFEGPTLLAAMAAHTSRIRCGILVVGNTYRNPAMLAKIAATIDHISNGRMELGIGAGWFEAEHEQYNVPYYTPGRRIRMLGESVKIIRSLFTETRTTFNGRYYSVHNALAEPKPVQSPLPIWIGGAGEQLTMRVVAESADGWNTFMIPLDEYTRKLEVLADHCKEVGRDPADIRKSLAGGLLLRETEAELADLQAQGGVQRGIVGTPEQCIEQIREYMKLGVGDFLFSGRVDVDMQSLELFAKLVAPALREEAKALLPA